MYSMSKIILLLYNITFPRKKAKLLVCGTKKGKFYQLQSDCRTRNHFLFCIRMLSKMRNSLALMSIEAKNNDTVYFLKISQASADEKIM